MKDRYSVARLVLVGLVFHLVFIASVFDCYFTSPVVHGMNSYTLGKPQAKRLVLIVGDGLRADLLLNEYPFPKIKDSPKIIAPHLRNIIETRGAFGISHTRVPTESRPGHVAIIAGMYEDVSAVTKGWKTNPVDFDSVFNQSSTTFSFGSPDILPMFARGAVPGRVLEWSYDAEEEDFTKDAIGLDNWVLNQLETLFKNATTDPTLDAKMRSEKVVFFLHLLGLDTTGHSYRPHSPEYMRNIQVVDQIVKRAERLMSDFYQDNETSFVFTADHGMSVIGNHGDGHPDCTRTPIVAWGKGVRGPLPDTPTTSIHDTYSLPWGLNHLYRRDISQADIAPLMATLIGSSWPINSVGVLPDVDPNQKGFLDMDEKSLAEVSLLNAKVILEQYRIKHELKQSTTWNYKPYHPLTSPQINLTSIQTQITSSQYLSARNSSFHLIHEGLKGLHYLQTYDQTLLRSVVVFAYLGWMLFAGLYVIRPSELNFESASGSGSGSGTNLKGSGKIDVIFHHHHQQLTSSPLTKNQPLTQLQTQTQTQTQTLKSISIITLTKYIPPITLLLKWFLFFNQGSPLTYYIYIIFPAYFWYQVLDEGLPVLVTWFFSEIQTRSVGGLNANVKRRGGGWGNVLKTLVGFGWDVGVVVLVLVQFAKGYTTRSIWTFGTLILSSNWLISFPSSSSSFFSSLKNFKIGIFGISNSDNKRLGVMSLGLGFVWIGVTLVCSVFPILDVDREENLVFITFGGIIFLLIGILFGRKFIEDMDVNGEEEVKKSQYRLLCVQLSFIAAITITTLLSAISLQRKQGLPLILQILNWILLVIPSLLPYFYHPPNPNPQTAQNKTLMYFLSFGPCFVILSLSVEGLFFIAYSAVLAIWVGTEREIRVGLVKSERESKCRSQNQNQNQRKGGESTSKGGKDIDIEDENSNSKGELYLRFKGNNASKVNEGDGLRPEEVEKVYRFRKEDVRVALILLFLVHLGFFGIGNVPSISSFYLAPVYRLIPVFSPFSMAMLLSYKLLAPFVMLSIQISLLNEALNLPPFSLLLVSFSINDIMTLLFFFRVKDTGSWLEIGESITFFFITSLLFLFTSGMSLFGEWLMKDVLDRMWIDTLRNAGLKLKSN